MLRLIYLWLSLEQSVSDLLSARKRSLWLVGSGLPFRLCAYKTAWGMRLVEGSALRSKFHIILAVALGISISSAAFAQDDKLIVPGSRVGPAQLGMTEGALYKLLGGPEGISSAPGSISYIYFHSGVYVHIDTLTHKVFEIDVGQNTDFQTAEGIKVGLTAETVKTALAEVNEHQPPLPGGIKRIDYKSGMTLTFLPNGTIFKIGVWIPGGPHF